jgi:hypothetical protein
LKILPKQLFLQISLEIRAQIIEYRECHESAGDPSHYLGTPQLAVLF